MCAQAVSPRRLELAGVRVVEGEHLTLFTDLPPQAGVDDLPAAFDAAVPMWAEYFGVDEKRWSRWHVQAFVIEDRMKFRALGLLPIGKPDFDNGTASGTQLWVVEQESAYYRRHLVLHEGTHAFMLAMLGMGGPDWYREGTAELFGTHRWDGERLAMRIIPAGRDEVPMWGRTKHIREAVERGNAPGLDVLLGIKTSTRDDGESYSWCWALANMLDAHPEYGGLLKTMSRRRSNVGFNRTLRGHVGDGWERLEIDWAAFAADLDYGFDAERMAVVHRPIAEVPRGGGVVEIDATRGWQSTGWRLRTGRRYRVSASGRFQIGADPEPWPCEPGGITIDYHRGHPLGVLLGAVVPEKGAAPSAFAQPVEIGYGAELKPERGGVLFLKVNDSPAQLGDNGGTVSVRIVAD